MNFCDSCKWWSFTYDDGSEKIGTCENIDVPDMLRIVQDEQLDEPTLYTSSVFGCIYHEKKGTTKAVTTINIPKL